MFYAVAPLALFLCAWLVAQRVQNYERGKPDDRSTTKKNAHRRLRDFRSGVWMQTLLRDPAAQFRDFLDVLKPDGRMATPRPATTGATPSPASTSSSRWEPRPNGWRRGRWTRG